MSSAKTSTYEVDEAANKHSTTARRHAKQGIANTSKLRFTAVGLSWFADAQRDSSGLASPADDETALNRTARLFFRLDRDSTVNAASRAVSRSQATQAPSFLAASC